MKVGDVKSNGAIRSLGSARAAQATSAYAKAAPVAPASDTVSVMGIPEGEMTPKVRDAIMSLMAEVDRLRQDLNRARSRMDELETLADTDPLLQVNNRRAFVRELSRAISLADRYDGSAGLIYIDLDDFKQINDSLGHAAGDAVLEHVVAVLSANVRESDAVGRLGGDEFGVILVHVDEAAVEQKAESLAQKVTGQPLVWNGQEVPITASVGAFVLDGRQSVDEALASADRAMYARKKQSKNEEPEGS